MGLETVTFATDPVAFACHVGEFGTREQLTGPRRENASAAWNRSCGAVRRVLTCMFEDQNVRMQPYVSRN